MKTCKFAILNKEMEYSMYLYILFFHTLWTTLHDMFKAIASSSAPF